MIKDICCNKIYMHTMHIISEMHIFDSYLSIIKLFYIIKETFIYI